VCRSLNIIGVAQGCLYQAIKGLAIRQPSSQSAFIKVHVLVQAQVFDKISPGFIQFSIRVSLRNIHILGDDRRQEARQDH
jgi:hypothetical protein